MRLCPSVSLINYPFVSVHPTFSQPAECRLETTEEAVELANDFISKGPLSEKATEDALHIAIAFVNGLDYLITWNCKRIANARMRHKIEQLCRARGYESAIICTPEELLEEGCYSPPCTLAICACAFAAHCELRCATYKFRAL